MSESDWKSAIGGHGFPPNYRRPAGRLSIMRADEGGLALAAEYAWQQTRWGEPPHAVAALSDEAWDWVKWASRAERRAYLSALLSDLNCAEKRTLARWLWGKT